jgi:hypothetical protein
MRVPRVELLWWEGCPSTEGTRLELRAAMEEVGLDPETVTLREIRTDAEAQQSGFPGSPTIRINGADVAPTGEEDPPALTCRVYRRRDGRVSPTPDPEDVRQALRAAINLTDEPVAR